MELFHGRSIMLRVCLNLKRRWCRSNAKSENIKRRYVYVYLHLQYRAQQLLLDFEDRAGGRQQAAAVAVEQPYSILIYSKYVVVVVVVR